METKQIKVRTKDRKERSTGTDNRASTSTSSKRTSSKEGGKVDDKRKRAKKSKKPLLAKPTVSKPAVLYSSKDSTNRSFTTQLTEYLDAWENRDSAPWKFSKVIQSWALENCFHKDKIDTDLFKRLIPYILTVQGGARDRLLTAADDMITKCESGETLLDDDEAPAVEKGEDLTEEVNAESKKPKISNKMLKRAMKIKGVLLDE
jgi:hypothetical protein